MGTVVDEGPTTEAAADFLDWIEDWLSEPPDDDEVRSVLRLHMTRIEAEAAGSRDAEWEARIMAVLLNGDGDTIDRADILAILAEPEAVSA